MFERVHFYFNWSDILIKLWILLIIGAIAVLIIPPLNDVANHGKIRKDIQDDGKETEFFFIPKRFVLVPKRYFTHFYILSTILTAFMILIDLYHFHFYLIKYLFLFHSCRRWLECKYITNYSDSLIHIGGYLVGMVHYIFAILTIEVSSIEKVHLKSHYHKSLFWVGLVLFFSMNYLQYQSHYILFKNKTKGLKENSSNEKEKKPNYSLPTEGLFNYCCCPHYFTEILIYFSLYLMENHCLTMLFMLIWVATNLSIVGYKQYLWYLKHDFDRLEDGSIKVLFPFIW